MKRKLLIISNIVLVMLSIALIILNSSLIVEYFSSIDKENGQNLSAGFAVVFLIIFSIPALIIGLGSVPLNIIFSKKVNKIWGIVFLVINILSVLLSAGSVFYFYVINN